MEIKTKYNIGDYSYFLSDKKIIEKEIIKITVSVNNDNKIDIIYYYYLYSKETMGSHPLVSVKEEFVFPTKEELLKSL